jgi:DNA-binding transcriptional ArsR family regulator
MTSPADDFEDMAIVFQALCHPSRLRIIAALAKGEMSVVAIYKKLKLPQSSTSHHLSLLREGGLVVNRREGHKIFYSIADLSKHRLGKKSELTKAKSNAAKFGPVELVLLQKAGRLGKLKELTRVFHSLGNKTRLSILMTLLTKGEMGVSAICKKLELPMGIISHHLKILHEGGLVVNRRDSKQIFYSIADLSKHHLGKKSELAKRGSNAARFGPVELIILK